ncbi:PucR family transcriptional regulator [Mediterraneibacter agrestimuris]|uniref:PucR family transcriptional regulator n=1 Tax=Mediterraneibacter agrestimuris TaxID=2941333 RepID=UPI00203FC146|nr:helix-turn-helix domain-containing protein [Mediterraneibacter agrestimuris]
MEYQPQLKAALKELKRITGIELCLSACSSSEEEAALNQIRCLITAYKEKYNKTQFLLSLMTDSAPSYDINERAGRLHISAEEPRVLYLLHVPGGMDETMTEILKHLFPSQTKTYLVPVTENTLVILKPMHADDTDEEIQQAAHAIVDTLNMEALVSVQVAYSRIFYQLQELAGAFQETSLALKVGRLFTFGENVFAYNKLGIGRLIYRLPHNICKDFLTEVFGPEVPDTLDEEMTTIIDRFLQNNLNIAETARQLHMHRNTLIYRLEQVEKQTGLDLRHFEDAMTFKIAVMVLNYLQTERTSHYE